MPRIITKDKDISKIRPIVSYYNAFGRTLGKRVARGISVIISLVKKLWNTLLKDEV
jgi:hypothetical protein